MHCDRTVATIFSASAMNGSVNLEDEPTETFVSHRRGHASSKGDSRQIMLAERERGREEGGASRRGEQFIYRYFSRFWTVGNPAFTRATTPERPLEPALGCGNSSGALYGPFPLPRAGSYSTALPCLQPLPGFFSHGFSFSALQITQLFYCALAKRRGIGGDGSERHTCPVHVRVSFWWVGGCTLPTIPTATHHSGRYDAQRPMCAATARVFAVSGSHPVYMCPQ